MTTDIRLQLAISERSQRINSLPEFLGSQIPVAVKAAQKVISSFRALPIVATTACGHNIPITVIPIGPRRSVFNDVVRTVKNASAIEALFTLAPQYGQTVLLDAKDEFSIH
jgi:hypothetical protein